MHGRGSKMNYIESVQQMFHCSSMDIAERMKYVYIKFSAYPSNIPSYEDLYSLISSFPSRDSLTIAMNDDARNSLRITSNPVCTQDRYADFQVDLYKDDPVYVTIEINKQANGNKMSIYCFQKFCADLLSLPHCDALTAFYYFILRSHASLF